MAFCGRTVAHVDHAQSQKGTNTIQYQRQCGGRKRVPQTCSSPKTTHSQPHKSMPQQQLHPTWVYFTWNHQIFTAPKVRNNAEWRLEKGAPCAPFQLIVSGPCGSPYIAISGFAAARLPLCCAVEAQSHPPPPEKLGSLTWLPYPPQHPPTAPRSGSVSTDPQPKHRTASCTSLV